MRNKLRFIKRVLYKLRQDYGLPVTYVVLGDPTIDYETGEQTIPETSYSISKMIKLPQRLSSFGKEVSSPFNYGGQSDRTKTRFVLEEREVPSGLTPDNRNQYILVDGSRFDVIEIVKLEDNSGYLIFTEAYEGAET